MTNLQDNAPVKEKSPKPRFLGRSSLKSGAERFIRPLKTEKARMYMRRGAVVCVALAGLFWLKSAAQLSVMRLPSVEEEKSGIAIFDRNDKLVEVVRKNNLRPVPLDSISSHMRNAVIAIEDRNFYHHLGIDFVGISRAALANLQAGHIVEGGSTISQQLAKVLFLTSDRSFSRKAKEAFISLDLETGYPKDRILETYLNHVYFGQGAYGVENAARRYFGTTAKNLTLAQSSFLAGLIKAPSTLGSKKGLKNARERQSLVLTAMNECGFIQKEKVDETKKQKLAFKYWSLTPKHPYYISHVIAEVGGIVGEDNVWKKPLRVYTNLDEGAQYAAEKKLRSGLHRLTSRLDQGALISISVDNGAVLSMVGGVGSYPNNQWNNAVNVHTAGSTFKPFVYLAGLIHHTLKPDSVVNDSPILIRNKSDNSTYSPQNYDHGFKGLLTVRDALALSRNVCAVKVADDVGIDKVIDTARKAGITAKMEPFPSTALGTCSVTPLELANSYATLARDGEYIEPSFIRRACYVNAGKKADGREIFRHKVKGKRVLPAEPVRQIVDVMQDVVTKGTGRRARIPGVAIAGKTGTSDDVKDVWFVGFTPEVVTAVWAGKDVGNKSSGGGSGGTVAAVIWRDYMKSYLSSHSPTIVAFNEPKEPLTTQLQRDDSWTDFFNNTVGFITGEPALASDGSNEPHHKRKGVVKSVISKIFDFL